MAGSESGWVDICYGWVEMGGDGIYFLNIFLWAVENVWTFYGWVEVGGHFFGWVGMGGGIFWMGAGEWG